MFLRKPVQLFRGKTAWHKQPQVNDFVVTELQKSKLRLFLGKHSARAIAAEVVKVRSSYNGQNT